MLKLTRWESLAAMTLFCWGLVLVAADPVPTADSQTKAEKLIKDIFKAEYAKAKLPTEKAALAEKLLAQGGDTKDDTAARFVLLREARDLAAESGAISTCFKAIDAMAKSYDIDVLAMKIEALTLAAKSAPISARKPVAEMAISILEEAVAADNYEAATRLATAALTAARSGTNSSLAQQATLRLKEVEEMKTAFESIKPAIAVLKEKPADADANTTVGKFLCLMKGDWEKGVPMLALGNDPELKRLAESELGKPADGKDKAAVGDAWWDLADKVPAGTAKVQLQRRAGYWYRQAATDLTGLTKAKIEKRITELGKFESPNSTRESKTVEPFNAKDLTGWKIKNQKASRWKVCVVQMNPDKESELLELPLATDKPYLTNLTAGSDIFTVEKFGDITLELEFMVPKGSNSGIYLMGEYEIQILDSFGKEKVGPGDLGGLYKSTAPKVNASKRAGEWQKFVIEFQAPRFKGDKKVGNANVVKMVLNDIVIHENVELTSSTPGGLTGREWATGPLMFQGDHGPVAFRDIKITPKK